MSIDTQKLLEVMSQEIIQECDMTDLKTSDFYWAFVKMQVDGIAAQLESAFDMELMKRAQKNPVEPLVQPRAPK